MNEEERGRLTTQSSSDEKSLGLHIAHVFLSKIENSRGLALVIMTQRAARKEVA